MALEAPSSPGPHWGPTGHGTCPARHSQGLALGWTAGNGALQAARGTDAPEAKASAPGSTARPGALRAALPPARPQAGPLGLPTVPRGRGPLGNLRPPPRPASGAGRPGATARPGLAGPAAALQGPPPSWTPLAGCPLPAHRQAWGLLAPQPLGLRPARPCWLRLPATAEPAPCPGTSAAHRRAWGWAGLAQADSSGDGTTSEPRRGLEHRELRRRPGPGRVPPHAVPQPLATPGHAWCPPLPATPGAPQLLGPAGADGAGAAAEPAAVWGRAVGRRGRPQQGLLLPALAPGSGGDTSCLRPPASAQPPPLMPHKLRELGSGHG